MLLKAKPDSQQKEFAHKLGISIGANAMRRMDIVRKKTFRYTQSLAQEDKRRRYLKRLYKAQTTQTLVAQADCHLFFLPLYSPHLNPIEKLWAHLKHLWRKLLHLSIDQLILSSR